MITCRISHVEYFVPNHKEFNDPNNPLTNKIGILSRNIALKEQYASDLAFEAVAKLFNQGVNKEEIDFFLYCTQSPDYILPSTACILHERLGLPSECGVMEFNHGCSGYIYGLFMAKSLIGSGEAKKVLLVTSDTYSKYINEKDNSVKPIFGDAAAATLIVGDEGNHRDGQGIGKFHFETDGRGGKNLIIPSGGLRHPIGPESWVEHEDERNHIRTDANLYMNGPEIFKYAYEEIPKAVDRLLTKQNQSLQDYDYFIFHQANLYMIDKIRHRLQIPKDKFSVQLSDLGNTVSSSIPIALKRDLSEGRIKDHQNILLVGFGVGYSLGACSIQW
ncbi:ketoacyl-ACP synthase III [Paenibacillus sinopodophylli]|uniref:ketoacyl-ACP synthase III n=1 Tax=Paenibacillus sinopodophylli TaxID=1837342 RepID=UPI001FE73519|nr:ketoacyl-ACP synthase III [Paenibacillus sinopodophylli]